MKERQEPPRARPHRALVVRGWVAGKPPEEIYRTLGQRIATIDETIDPHRNSLAVFLQRFYDQVLVATLGWTSVPVSPDRVQVTGRAIAWTAISHYWRNHPYKGKYLPRITIRGYPWRSSPTRFTFWTLPRISLWQVSTRVGRLSGSMRLSPARPAIVRPRPSQKA